MITDKITALFSFIEFLHSNIEKFKQYDEVINELYLLDNERKKLNPRKNFTDKLKYDEIQYELKNKFKVIKENIIQEIQVKASELKICDLNKTETLWNWNISEIDNLKKNFSKDDIQEILQNKSKYLEFRTKTNCTYFQEFFFDGLDEILKELFDFFKESTENEFEVFETETIQVNSFREAVEQIQKGQKKITLPIDLLNLSKVQRSNNEVLPPQQPKENTEPNRLQMAKGAVITNKWANGLIAEMKYNSTEIWHQVAGYHYEGVTLYKNHQDHILDTVNFPVITKGLTAYLIQNLGKPEHLIFDKYYENCLNNYKQVEARKPGSSMRNLDAEFYPIHIAQEKEFITFSEKIHPYLSKAENELIDQYTEAYFKYIEQVYSPKGSTEEGTLEKQEAGNELSVPDWCIIFYYIDEVGTQEGNKIDRMEKFIEDNNVVSPSGVHTTKSNFKKEYHEIENRINSKNNKKPLPPKRIENILHYLKNNKKALQAAESDIEHLTNEIEEYKRNTY